MIQRHPGLDANSEPSSGNCGFASEPSIRCLLDGNGGAEKMFLEEGGGSDNAFLVSVIRSSISVNYRLDYLTFLGKYYHISLFREFLSCKFNSFLDIFHGSKLFLYFWDDCFHMCSGIFFE